MPNGYVMLPGFPPPSNCQPMMPMSTLVRRAITEARVLIAHDGWTQRTWMDSSLRRCLGGALRAVCPTGSVVHDACVELTRGIDRAEVMTMTQGCGCPMCADPNAPVPSVSGSGSMPLDLLILWNDVTGRTVDEVLALMDNTIARLDARDGRLVAQLSERQELPDADAVALEPGDDAELPAAVSDYAHVEQCPDDCALLAESVASCMPASECVTSCNPNDLSGERCAECVSAPRELVDACL